MDFSTIYVKLVQVTYTPQGGPEQSAVQKILPPKVLEPSLIAILMVESQVICITASHFLQ